MPRIQPLPPEVVNQIAAGEVIERPASVVKELVENSLDALATRIEVTIGRGGVDLIRVADDGEGMGREDLPLAVTSHATSKITRAEDLFRVRTLGFRGEALASIASVSHFRMRSRQAQSELGYEITANGATSSEPQAVGCPVGTVVEIRDLFHNTPARRKFLKTVGTEFGHVSEQFTRIALANPRLHAVLIHNDRTIFDLPPTDRLLDRLTLFHGREIGEKLLWIESEIDSIRLWGYVGDPSVSRPSRKGQYLFLNGRWIQDRSLQHALGEAYRGLLMVGRYPVAYLFLELPPDLVDVNVHPTKAEVRFENSQLLYRHLLSTLRTRFLSLGFETKLHLPKKLEEEPPAPSEPAGDMQAEFAAWADQALSDWTPDEESEGTEPSFAGSRREPVRSPELDSVMRRLPSPTTVSSLSASTATVNGDRREPGDEIGNEFPGDDDPIAASASVSADADQFAHSDDFAHSDKHVAQHNEAVVRSAPQPGWPHRALQVLDTYLVLETDRGLTLIDQHALHERIMYEHLRPRVLSHAVEVQRLLAPEPLELSPRDLSLLLSEQEALRQVGYDIQEFGRGTLLLLGYPAMLRKADHHAILRDLADQIADSRGPNRRDLLDRMLHMMSCKAAVKAGQRLTEDEIAALLTQRHLVDDAHHCPHGRPTALVLSRAELDRQFGRLG